MAGALRIEIEAFVSSEGVREAVVGASESATLRRAKVNVAAGGFQEAAARYAAETSRNVLIVEASPESSREAVLAGLDGLAQVCADNTELIVIGHMDSIVLYRDLMARDVGQYLLCPVSAKDIAEAVDSLFSDPGARPKGKTIAFVGAKGGVGSSTLCHNVGWLMAESLGIEAHLVDLDLCFGTLSVNFNQEPRTGLRDVLSRIRAVDEPLVQGGLLETGKRLKLLGSTPSLYGGPIQDMDALDFVLDTLRGLAAVTLLDLPTGWSPITAALLSFCDEAVIVAEPTIACLRNAQLISDEVGGKRPVEAPLRVVLNNVGLHAKSEIAPQDFKDGLGFDPVCQVPHEAPVFRSAAAMGQMIAEAAPRARSVARLTDLAELLAGKRPAKAAKKSGLWLPWRRV